MVDHATTPWQAGRVGKRLLEIDTYRILALVDHAAEALRVEVFMSTPTWRRYRYSGDCLVAFPRIHHIRESMIRPAENECSETERVGIDRDQDL